MSCLFASAPRLAGSFRCLAWHFAFILLLLWTGVALAGPAPQLPDLSLRPSTVTSYAGMGIYNLDGSGQTVGLSVAKTVKATYYVHLQNNGNIADTLKLSGSAAPAGWTVEYKNYSTGAVITSAVTGDGWSTALLNPGAVVTVAVYVTPGSTVNLGTVATQTLTVTSVADAGKQDVGVITTTVPVVNRPDLYVRPSTVPSYIGSGVYNLDGTNQTVGLSVTYGVKATYYVTVKNNGNSPDTFTITGPAAPSGWTVAYKLGLTVITGAVTTTGWTTALLNPAATIVMTVYVTPSSSAIAGTVATQTVTVTSNGDSTKQDVGVLNTTLPVLIRPDLQLRPSTVTSYIGSGIYNLDGTNQTVGLTVANGAKATYYLTLKNNGNIPDTCTITGPAAPAGWTVSYNYGATVITDALTSTGWTTPVLNPAATLMLTVYVTPSISAIGGTVATQMVTVTSNSDASKQDAGVLHTTLTVVNLPDLRLRPSTVTTYTGSGIYNLDGTNQTVGQSVLSGMKATYYVTVKNNGNAPEAFIISSPSAPSGWTVEFKLGSTVITGAVTTVGWTTPVLNPTESVVVTVYITPGSAIIIGSIDEQIVTVTSSGDATKQDVGIIRTTVIQAPPTITHFTPSSSLTGQVITITGTFLTGATAVTFNGVPATTFNVEDSTTISTIVPTEASSGKIAVTTPGGIATSAASFTVLDPAGSPAVNPSDNADMVWVPGGSFLMGSNDNNDWLYKPYTQQVTLTGFWSYKYEVTVAQYLAFCAATAYPLPPFPGDIYSWAGKSGWTDPALQQHPIVNVNWYDAKAYAAWAGVSLPTEAQWEYAARGPEGRNYPWGGIATAKDTTNGWDATKCANYSNTSTIGKSTWPVGSFPTGVSWCGVEDMAGNVSEWNEDAVYGYSKTPVTDPRGYDSRPLRMVQGGAWDAPVYFVSSYFRSIMHIDNETKDFSKYDAGFRCILHAPFSVSTPNITGFSSPGYPIGQVVKILGTNFTGVTRVAFNGVPAINMTVLSPTIISVTIPVGATTGKVTVMSPWATAISPMDFKILPDSSFISFTPKSGPIGQVVTITGAELTGATAVKFNDTLALSFTVLNNTTLIATVPDGATNGIITVIAPTDILTSFVDFIINDAVGTPAVNYIDGAVMVLVPGGSFIMGTDYDPYVPIPDMHQVTLTGYFMYKYEVTVAQYRAFCAATSHALPPFPSQYIWEGKSSWANATLQQHPIVNVTWYDAQAYANWAGVELPTEAQWEYASRGMQGFNYPWGGIVTATDPYNGFSSSSCANEYSSSHRGGGTWPVGSFSMDKSWCGVQDMAGNVVEWCLDFAGSYPSSPVLNPTGPATSNWRIQRSGSWNEYCDYEGRGVTRRSSVPSLFNITTGFRCAIPISSPITSPSLSSFTPMYGPDEGIITLTGTNFTGVTSVAFNGIAAIAFTVMNPTTITVAVPPGAITGKITVTTSGGTASSAMDYTVTQTPMLTDINPSYGIVGQVVTLTGTNFTYTTEVAFNGLAAPFTLVNNTSITVTIPPNATSGFITISGSQGTITSATEFNVYHPPIIYSFTPTSGLPGSIVTITGTNFIQMNKVYFNGIDAYPYITNSATSITVTVPRSITTGKITVTTDWGIATSIADFIVLPPAPIISGFSPASCPIGQLVTLSGLNFTGATSVTINGLAAVNFKVVSSTSLTVTVPEGASSGKITVTTPGGTVTSTTTLTVLPPLPTLSGFSPASGPIGQVVTLTGTHLTGTTAVAFNNTAVTIFTVLSATSVTATVPPDASSGKITVTTPDGTGTSATNFTVIPPPTLVSFSPSSGLIGQVVTFTGTDFTSATTVAFNGIIAVATFVNTTSITATVPTGAATGKISVTTSAGTATSTTDFTVIQPPTLSSFTPTSGLIGQVVTLTGTHFTGATVVKFNGILASFTVVSDTSITVTVPTDATTGNISVSTPDGIVTSVTNFTVIFPPTISGFSPASACIGQVITITGTNFAGTTAVAFNGVAATSFTVVSATVITATIPFAATTGKISVTNPAGTVSSVLDCIIIPSAPTLISFSPTSGSIGQVVTLTGTGFTGASVVKFNGTNASVFQVVSATSITVTTPDGATSGPISVTTSGGTGSSTTNFIILGPSLTNFSPYKGGVGKLVTLTGVGFMGTTSVTFNGVAATYTVVSSTSITVTVPVGATTGKIAITTPDGTVSSSTNFTVIPAPILNNFTPDNGLVGKEVLLTGMNFTGATAVSFNGKAASFTVSNTTVIFATVPVGATTGKITIMTPGGTVSSARDFTIFATLSLTGFSPAQTGVSHEVTISGSGFTGVSAVAFQGLAATFTVVNASTITAIVPVGASSGKIAVTTAEGTVNSTNNFIVTPPPTIIGFTPASNMVGQQVTLTGTDFSGATAVTLNGMAASSFIVMTPTSIIVTVPDGASSGPIRVTTPGGSADSATNFTVLPVLAYFDFTPASALIGQVVTLTGTNFTGVTAVTFNGVAATFSVQSATTITATVPGGAASGKIIVTLPGGRDVSATDFIINDLAGTVGSNPTDAAAMVWVPAGTFIMGDLDSVGYSAYRPAHFVTLSGYWIYRNEVTVAQYRVFCLATARALPVFPTGRSWAGKSGWDDPALQQHPIVNVTWNDTKAYADWAGVRLPTEAQWEYAARGLSECNYPWGGTATPSDASNGWDQTKCANCYNSGLLGISTWPVGSFPDISWCGVQDMAGNAQEWCNDFFSNYSASPVTNPTGPVNGSSHILRGGSWISNDMTSYRCVVRNYLSPTSSNNYLGFRCVSLAPGP